MTSFQFLSKISDLLKKNKLISQFGAKFTSNFLGGLASIANQAILMRLLGPVAYGNFSYLNKFFENVLQLCDMGSSSAYYTKVSKRNEEKKTQ